MIVSGQVRFHPDLEPLLRPIADIHPAPWNYNNGDVEAIGESIDDNGMCDIVLVQRSTGDIISGNHTYEALMERDSDLAPMVLLDVDDTRAKKIAVAMNVIPRRARPDNALLLDILDDLPDLRGTGVTKPHREALEKLAEMVPTYHKADWPWISVQIHPRLYKAYRHATREADTDADRIELLLRLAGAL